MVVLGSFIQGATRIARVRRVVGAAIWSDVNICVGHVSDDVLLRFVCWAGKSDRVPDADGARVHRGRKWELDYGCRGGVDASSRTFCFSFYDGEEQRRV